jgi:hypothetical protein
VTAILQTEIHLMATATTKAPSFLAPERLYSLKGFQSAAGISATRMREGRQAGITLPTLEVGRRKFVRGTDAIAYLEKLAELNATA